jgi:hypothetical protein
VAVGGGRGGVRAWQCQLLRQEPRRPIAIPVGVSRCLRLQNNGNVARVRRVRFCGGPAARGDCVLVRSCSRSFSLLTTCIWHRRDKIRSAYHAYIV